VKATNGEARTQRAGGAKKGKTQCASGPASTTNPERNGLKNKMITGQVKRRGWGPQCEPPVCKTRVRREMGVKTRLAAQTQKQKSGQGASGLFK